MFLPPAYKTGNLHDQGFPLARDARNFTSTLGPIVILSFLQLHHLVKRLIASLSPRIQPSRKLHSFRVAFRKFHKCFDIWAKWLELARFFMPRFKRVK